MSQKQMLNLEFTWGRWNGDDVQEMLEPMQIAATRLGQFEVSSHNPGCAESHHRLAQRLREDDGPSNVSIGSPKGR